MRSGSMLTGLLPALASEPDEKPDAQHIDVVLAGRGTANVVIVLPLGADPHEPQSIVDAGAVGECAIALAGPEVREPCCGLVDGCPGAVEAKPPEAVQPVDDLKRQQAGEVKHVLELDLHRAR